MNDSKNRDETGWERGWHGHDLAQRRRIARLPLYVKIKWLEDTQRLVQNLARKPDDPDKAS